MVRSEPGQCLSHGLGDANPVTLVTLCHSPMHHKPFALLQWLDIARILTGFDMNELVAFLLKLVSHLISPCW
jgi:hypothetical protein